PEKDAEWSDRGAEGAYRFLGRVWRLVEKVHSPQSTVHSERKPAKGEIASPPSADRNDEGSASCPHNDSLRRKIHFTIKKVTEDFDGGFHFNTAISSIMELVNETYEFLSKSEGQEKTLNEAIEAIIILLSPFVPHIAEELWERIGKKNSIFKTKWPEYDRSAIVEDVVTMVVQVNGKLRSRVEVPSGIKEEELKTKVLSDPKIKELTSGKIVKNFIVVPKKLINIVIHC
ncbi:MAG: class I tRNA ligase family protein, partial [Candidatus Omnitrophota bacterium]|nr:class I tRNA ligase family protein [Candidatus Omnitrophota bacterium]